MPVIELPAPSTTVCDALGGRGRLRVAGSKKRLQIAFGNHYPAANFSFAKPSLAQPAIDRPSGNTAQPHGRLFSAQEHLFHRNPSKRLQKNGIVSKRKPV